MSDKITSVAELKKVYQIELSNLIDFRDSEPKTVIKEQIEQAIKTIRWCISKLLEFEAGEK